MTLLRVLVKRIGLKRITRCVFKFYLTVYSLHQDTSARSQCKVTEIIRSDISLKWILHIKIWCSLIKYLLRRALNAMLKLILNRVHRKLQAIRTQMQIVPASGGSDFMTSRYELFQVHFLLLLLLLLLAIMPDLMIYVETNY